MIEQTPSASATQGIAQMTASGTAGVGKGHAARGGLFAALLALLSAKHNGKAGENALAPGAAQAGKKMGTLHETAFSVLSDQSHANGQKSRMSGDSATSRNMVQAGNRGKKQIRAHADLAPTAAVATAVLPQAIQPEQAGRPSGSVATNIVSQTDVRPGHPDHPANTFTTARQHPASRNIIHTPQNTAPLRKAPAQETPTENGMKQAARQAESPRQTVSDAAPSRESLSISATNNTNHAQAERNISARQIPDELLRDMEVRNDPVAESIRQAAGRAREDGLPRLASHRATQDRQMPKTRTGENAALHARSTSTTTEHDMPRAGTRPAPDTPQVPEQSWQTRNQTPQTHAARPHGQGQNPFQSHAPATGVHTASPAVPETTMNASGASSMAQVATPPALQPAATASEASPAPAPQAHDGPSRMFGPMRALEAVQQIAHSAAQGQTRLDIQLEPAHLGKVHVSLQTDAAKQLIVHITAEQPAAQQAIQQHLPQLRMALESQGMQPGGFSLNAGMSGDGQGQWQGNWQDGQHASGFGGRHDGPATTPATVAANREADVASRHSSGRLSIHV